MEPDSIDFDPTTAIREIEREERYRRESESMIAAAYRRALKLDLLPLALALLDADVADTIEYMNGTQTIVIETSPESYDDVLADDRPRAPRTITCGTCSSRRAGSS